MQLGDQLISAGEQVVGAIVIGGLAYGANRLFARKNLGGRSFLNYLGIRSAPNQLDRKFFMIWSALSLFGMISTILEYRFSGDFRHMLTGKNSPFGTILMTGFGVRAAIQGLVYCFIQASGSEEILFRGLIAKRLFSSMGFLRGNIIQAIVFWFMHLAIFRLITGEWVSVVQLLAFVNSFGLGLILGYANFRRGGESIIPSWLLHGSVNFFAFLTLATLWT